MELCRDVAQETRTRGDAAASSESAPRAGRAARARGWRTALAQPAGFGVRWKAGSEGEGSVVWEPSRWPLRRERLYLLGGDSPLGLRLPLGALPDTLPEDDDREAPVDPFA